VEASSFNRFLRDYDAAAAFAEYLVDRVVQASRFQAFMTLRSPLRRISWLLFEVLDLAGPEVGDPRHIPISQEAIASALGLARSTVAECLRQLRTAGVLSAGRRLVVVDAEALRRVACV
jgi:CRP-like cAMP-binding protein